MNDRAIEQALTKHITVPGYKDAAARALVGFQKLGDQDPYFHVLCAVDHKLGNNRWESSYPNRFRMCADHASFLEHFKPFEVLVRYHLWSIHNGPMHYVYNTLYYARQLELCYKDGNLAEDTRMLNGFKQTCGFGLLPTDGDVFAVLKLDEDDLKKWLDIRLPALMWKFKNDCMLLIPGIWEKAEEL